jgi:MoxR-like ATPase
VRDGVRYGASPRAVQALIRTAEVEALRAGRLQVDVVDIQRVALPVLLIGSYYAASFWDELPIV